MQRPDRYTIQRETPAESAAQNLPETRVVPTETGIEEAFHSSFTTNDGVLALIDTMTGRTHPVHESETRKKINDNSRLKSLRVRYAKDHGTDRTGAGG